MFILDYGGRGWGSKGNMYYDDLCISFVNSCEKLKVQYGFYFLDEALNDEEILEEVNFVKEFLQGKDLKYNVLPLALDLEYQHGKGRTDYIWNTRVPLINKLVSTFSENGIETIIYANSARIETFLKNADCKFWAATYPEDNKIPNINFRSFIKQEQNKLIKNPNLIASSFLNSEINKCGTETITYSDEFLNKVIGWQFTQNGASLDNISMNIDLSIFNKNI